MSRAARHAPMNSMGQPWTIETWSCTRCGATGPDRDDVRSGSPGGLPFPGCSKGHASGHGHCDLVYTPALHDAAIRARRGERP